MEVFEQIDYKLRYEYLNQIHTKASNTLDADNAVLKQAEEVILPVLRICCLVKDYEKDGGSRKWQDSILKSLDWVKIHSVRNALCFEMVLKEISEVPQPTILDHFHDCVSNLQQLVPKPEEATE